MSRFMDMTVFGEAGRYLRLTNLEQLAAKAMAFDGVNTEIYSHSEMHFKLITRNLKLIIT